MASKLMPRKPVTKSSVPCDPSAQTAELQTKVKKLQAELDAERTKVKQLRREKNLECRQIREQEQNNARIALKDLKSKFTVAKQRELEIQKETLNRRYEAELGKVRKQKDGEIAKLRSNLRKCQNELTEAIHCLASSAQHHGLSGAARASSTFESERAKLLAEVQELNNSKRQVDEIVKTLTESERQKTHTIKLLEERLKSDVEKFKKDADIEAKRLLDELKSKDRQIAQLEKDTSVRDGQITKLRHEAEATMEQTKRNHEFMRRFASKGLCKKTDSLSSLESGSSDSGADVNGPPSENEQQCQQLQEQIKNLREQNNQLTSKLRDSEDKHRPLHDKARKFLEKNMEQTALNRDLEDRIKVLNEKNNSLKVEVEKTLKENKHLSEELNKGKADKTLITELEYHIDELRNELCDQEDIILALQHACTEKDRRLELLSHRKRKERNNRSQQKVVRFLLPDDVQMLAAGIKETYYGYDEDGVSVDSEGSSKLSLDNTTLDDDIFDDVSKEECEKNYQILAREHLELERSYALLQNQAAYSPTNSNEFKEMGWTDDEKLALEKTVQKLQYKLRETEGKLDETSEQLKETLEQHEDLEFQLLELQEAHDKLLEESEETKSELSFHQEEKDSKDEPGALEAKNEELRKKIHKLQGHASQETSTEERALLLQAKILLDVSDKKIKELTTNEETLKNKIEKFEEEKVTLLSQSAGEPKQLVLEYEQIRNELQSFKQENEQLKETNIILESQNKDLSDQVEQWSVVSKMDVTDKAEATEKPVSQLLEEEIQALKYGELQLAGQNTRLSKELSRVRQELDSTKDELIAANLVISKAAELKKENVALTEELSVVKTELKTLQEKLSTASVEKPVQILTTRLSLDEDLVDDNQRLRAEIFSLQEQLKAYESQSSSQSESADITSPEHRIKVLEKEIADLKHHNELLKDKLKEREKDVLKSREVVVSIETDLNDLEKENDELRNKLDDLETEDDNEVAALRVKVRALERSARMLQEQLETTGGDVSTSIEDVVEELEQEKDKVAELRKHMDRMAEDLIELEELKRQVAELESLRHDHNVKLAKLQHLKELADGQTDDASARSPRSTTSESSTDDEHRDLHSELRKVKIQNSSLVVKLNELEEKLAEQSISEALGETEKDRRIQVLEKELRRIQANEDTLNDTIEELREVENELKLQVSKHDDSASDSEKSDEKLDSLQLDLTKLRTTNSGVLSQIVEMTESERSLREQLSNTEEEFRAQISELQKKLADKETDSSDDEIEQQSADESGDNKSDKSKIAKLEARIKELAAKEGDLLEEVYAMKLENQELQEHVELLEAAQESPRSSEGESPRSKADDYFVSDLRSKIKQLEEEVEKLKDELVKAKLKTVSDESDYEAGELKRLQDKVNDLEKNETHLRNEVKLLEGKVSELETIETNLKVEIIRIREFEAMAKEHELCEKRFEDADDKITELKDKVKNMQELEKELTDFRNQKSYFDKEPEIIKASLVGPLGSARKSSISSDSESESEGDNEKVSSLNVKDLENEVLMLGDFEVKNKEPEVSENKMKEELGTLKDQMKELEHLKTEVERLKKYEAVYSVERAEVEIETKYEGQIELEPVVSERLEKEFVDQQLSETIQVAVEKETVLAAVSVGSVDRKRRCSTSSESDQEEVRQLRKQLKDLEEQLEQIPELKSQLDKMKEQNGSLIQNLTKMKLQVDEMEADKRELNEQLRKRSGLQAQLHDMEAQLAAQNEQLMDYHNAVEVEKSKLKEDKEELKKMLDEMEDRSKEVEGERDELKASLVMAKEETRETIAKFEKFNQDFEEIKDEKDKLKATNEDLSSQMEDLTEIATLSDELREQNTSLQNEFDALKAKLDETVIEKENLEKSEKDLKESAEMLEEQLKSKSDTEVKLFEKIEVLVEAEGRLMEKLEEAEEEEDLLREELEKVKEENQKLRRNSTSESEADSEIRGKVDELEKKERDLKEQITVLEVKKEELENKLEAAKNSEDEELVKLREKVDILIDTEEKLMDRLQEQEVVESKLREQLEQLGENEKELRVQLVTAKEQQDTRSRSSSSADSESSRSTEEITKLEQNEKVMKQRINELEKSEAVLAADLRGLEKTLETLAKSETDIKDRLQDSEQERRLLQLKYDELSKMELSLHTKVGDLEDENKNLLHAIQEKSRSKDFVSSSEEEVIVPQSAVTIATTAASPPGARRRWPQQATSSDSSTDDQELHDLSRDELIARLQDARRELSELPDRSETAAGKRPRNRLQYSDDYTEDSGLESLQLSFNMLDSSEAILRQRVAEYEKLEQHHKQQITEMEKDREELHEIARHDKNHIHELSVRNREYELSEKNLKEQVNNLEASESELQLQVDNLTDKIEELDGQMKNMKLIEKQLRQALVKTENNESELSVQLDNAKVDVEQSEKQYKRKLSELSGDKVNLATRVEDLTLRVSDLERDELTLKRKLKNAEDENEASQEKVVQLEESENYAQSRVQELEAVNEALSQKLHKLEEEKASLLYELSDLETTHIDGHDTVHKLKASQRRLLEDLASREGAGSLMQKKLQEYMERENKLESELEDHKKSEKQWNDKREKMEETIAALTARVQELEAIIASNETKMSFVNDLEKENGILHRNIGHQQKTIQKSDQEIHRLQDKLMQFEYSSANNALATVPKEELADLRNKAKQLVTAEENIAKLDTLEKHLRECIEKLREGEDAHGYELEIAEMKEKVNKYNQLVQAHELLKENHEHAKNELKALREQLQKRGVEVTEENRPESESKGILARLTHSFTLSDITPELKLALKQLESNHPAAYNEFVRTLHPGAGSMAVIKQPQDQPAKMKFSDEEVSETQIRPVDAASVAASQPDSEESRRQGTKMQVYGRVAQPHTEETVWSAIEGPSTPGGRTSDEDNLWTDIEGPKEDLTLTVILGDEESDIVGKSASVFSVGSSGSSHPPPLPETIPPELAMRRLDSPGNDSSYYLPSAHESVISADEASDIDEDEITGLNALSRPSTRAKSVDRDSVISESLLSASPGRRMASSMDSIPDSGMGTLHQSEREILREKIAHLERQLKVKDKELNLVQINQRELDVSDTSRTIVELQDKVQRLQEDVKLKDAELEQLQGNNDLAELEYNMTSLKMQLDMKEQEITQQNKNLDYLKEELEMYKDDTNSFEKDKNSLEDAMKELEKQTNSNKELEEKYSELQTDFSELQREYNHLEERLNKTADSEQTIEELEGTVMKLRGQLSDLEKLELERQELQTKLNEVEEEFKTLKSQNKELLKEKASLVLKVEQLARDNKALQISSTEFNKMKSKYLSAEKRKAQAEDMITPLRTRVIKLSKNCKEKDNLIERLVKEARKANKKSATVLEANEMLSKSAFEDYHRPLTPLNVPSSDEEEIVLGDMPPLVSASVLHSGTDNSSYGVLGAQKPKAPTNQIEALIEPKLSNGTQMTPAMSNGSAHPSADITIDDLVSAPKANLAPANQHSEESAHTLPKSKKRTTDDPMFITRTASSTEHYRAVKDYSPEDFSRSGHKRLELPLKEGDIVKVLGSTDTKGYFEAELDGRVGLVPANYLQPVYPARPHRPKSDIYGDKAPEQILSMHADLQRSHVPHHKVPHVSSTYDDQEGARSDSSSGRSSTREGGSSITHPMFLGAPVMPVQRKPNSKRTKPTGAQPYITHPGHHNRMNGYPMQIATSLPSLPSTSAPTSTTSEASLQPSHSSRLSGHPAPPVAFQLQRIVGRHSLLLAWKAPVMDELARSNGVPVTGYRLQVDGRDKQDLPSPHLTKALVEHLSLHKPHHFTLQTVSGTGAASRPVYTSYQGPSGVHRGEDEGDSAGDGDVSSIMSSLNGAGDHDKRVAMAIYNYNPQKQSPKDDYSDELTLTAGDILTIHGPARPDGFYNAKMKGRKGLVPANFIEEIALFRSGSHRSLVSGGPVSHPLSAGGSRPSSSRTKQTKPRS